MTHLWRSGNSCLSEFWHHVADRSQLFQSFVEPHPARGAIAAAEPFGSFAERMLEMLRKSPVLRLEGSKTVELKHVRPPAKTLSLSAEAFVEATATGQQPTLARECRIAEAHPLRLAPGSIVAEKWLGREVWSGGERSGIFERRDARRRADAAAGARGRKK